MGRIDNFLKRQFIGEDNNTIVKKNDKKRETPASDKFHEIMSLPDRMRALEKFYEEFNCKYLSLCDITEELTKRVASLEQENKKHRDQEING